jgi:HTH-type transcriptional regulator, transcriptional repressor of NAD biosynthesis genes
MRRRPRHGMLLGKFLPPHLGHVYLVEFARRYVEDLAVVICSLAREPIPGTLRHAWMRELFPDARVLHLTDELPQEPSEHPLFWDMWRESLLRILPSAPDCVFASEAYGAKLAEVLGAEFVPVDPGRSIVPVSGTAIRNDPLAQWRYLPRCVRPYFVRRFCVFGPESTGKSSLAVRLARHYDTVAVPEYARTLLESRPGPVTAADIARIAFGQAASEEALAREANRLLVCDTDLLTTVIWSEALFGDCPTWIREEAERHTYDLYLLLDVDVPFVPDPVRYLPGERESFLARSLEALESRGRRYVRLYGTWDERFEQAVAAIDRTLRSERTD